MIWRRKTKEFDKSLEEINKSEMERITQELIEELVGQHGEISNSLNSMLELYNAKNNPIGIDEAKAILIVLIRIAATKRRRLSQKVSESLDHGRLFQYYNNRLSQIDRLTEDAYLAMKEMQAAREKFEREKNIYEQISGRAYDRHIDLKDSSKDVSNKKFEMWDELDKEITINHDETKYILQTNNSQLSYIEEKNNDNSTTNSEDFAESATDSELKNDNPESSQQEFQNDTGKSSQEGTQEQTNSDESDEKKNSQESTQEQTNPDESDEKKNSQESTQEQTNPDESDEKKNSQESTQEQTNPDEFNEKKNSQESTQEQTNPDESDEKKNEL